MVFGLSVSCFGICDTRVFPSDATAMTRLASGGGDSSSTAERAAGGLSDSEAEWAARDPDVALMLRAREGSDEAFGELASRYRGRLLGVLTHWLGGRSEDAEDLAQEVFLRVHRARGEYRPRSRFSTWLFTIANHAASNHLRGRRRSRIRSEADLGLSGEAERVAGFGDSPSGRMREAEMAAMVRSALGRLGDEQRLAVLLSKFEGMSHAEIGEVTGRSEAAVKSLLARARTQLRDLLAPYLESGWEPGGGGDGVRRGSSGGDS